jgi:hypothetical protein
MSLPRKRCQNQGSVTKKKFLQGSVTRTIRGDVVVIRGETREDSER